MVFLALFSVMLVFVHPNSDLFKTFSSGLVVWVACMCSNELRQVPYQYHTCCTKHSARVYVVL